ncbi:hypothetical protein MNBD_ALPHA04-1209 [hydrothermal vent metagenome]|uniref:GxxExxY protein n=1 Tax=hydrothermal vent metagenome TaxID=652676 RepID=A0A3B0R6C2_9ZZZZ
MELNLEKLESIVIDCGHGIYDELGSGLLKNVYETVLTGRLEAYKLKVERNKSVPIKFDGKSFDEGFRCDLLVEGRLLIGVESSERIMPVQEQYLATYIRLMNLPLGLLLNFGALSYRQGIRRIVNGLPDI